MSTATTQSERAGKTPLEPLPPHDRHLSGLDLAVLWGDLGIGLLVLVTASLLVPALGFAEAAVVIGLGSVVGVGLLGLAAAAGAEQGVPTMVLFRPVLGVRGSWVPSVLNALQLIGWTAVELWAMSFVADLVAERVFDVSLRWLWLVISAAVCTGLALWGPVGVTRVWMERFGVWVIGAISVVVTILVLTSDGIGAALAAPGAGGFPTFGPALDLVIAMPISWLPLVADYSRFGRSPKAAGTGVFVGYLIANVWLYLLGVLLVLGAGATPTPGGIAAGVLALAGGSIAGVLFLVGLLVGETDEAFADIYSGAVSLQNVFPRVSRRTLIGVIAVPGVVLAGWLTMDKYEVFLFLLGSVFVPLFGVLLAHYFVLPALESRRHGPHVAGTRGRAREAEPGFRWRAFVPWIAGFIVYHWVLPTGPAWWIERVTALATPLAEKFEWLPATLPSFLVAFALTIVLHPRSAPEGDPRRSTIIR